MVFQEVPEKVVFPLEEKKIINFWKELDAFKLQLYFSQNRPRFTFYDGPPFATGLPHYGHILAGTIKDIVTRFYVERRFGWDTHGLPVEHEVDKKFNITGKKDVEAMGIAEYNRHCRATVMNISGEWKHMVERTGRWIDFENDYRTLYPSYMESCWWVFKNLYEKGLIYKGFKVMPYSTACCTPLSNFEINDTYAPHVDTAATVTFPLLGHQNVCFVAWTTTPWTLPSNMCLAVKPDEEYAKVKDRATGNLYILMLKRLSHLYPALDENESYEVIEKFVGASLEGVEYLPPFEYFSHNRETGSFRVLCADFVTTEVGTGIVHVAPAFGEDDFELCLSKNIIKKGEDIPCPVDEAGRFTSKVPEWQGMHVKAADKSIVHRLKTIGRLIKQEEYRHNIPFCWRSDTPLIYKAVPSWFIHVESVKDLLIEKNKQIRWVPEFVGSNRFHNWLVTACDWSISRSRYWGTPLPVWVSDDEEEVVCVGSIAELEKLTGQSVTDLHRDSIDQLRIPSLKGKGMLKRVEEVFDCWFESGSMPYAQKHYPFENKEDFFKSFPADFIAEGLDQTRGWFYTLLVIGVCLFGEAPFQNVIVNGHVLASDGKKMSKRLKNYPDTNMILDVYGADALRLYLINSPVVRAEPLRFMESGVSNIVAEVLRPLYHGYRFFVQCVHRYEQFAGVSFFFDFSMVNSSANIMDKWILASLHKLIQFVNHELTVYRLYTVVPQMVAFVDDLTNWYLQFNRERLKGINGGDECKWALDTLFEVLFSLVKLMAPFTPFISESMYQNLKEVCTENESLENRSVHFLLENRVREEYLDKEVVLQFRALQCVVGLGRLIRTRALRPMKCPLKTLIVINSNTKELERVGRLENYVRIVLNVRNVVLSSNEDEYNIGLKISLNNRTLGKRIGKDYKSILRTVKNMTSKECRDVRDKGYLQIGEHILQGDDYTLETVEPGTSLFASASNKTFVCLMDVSLSEEQIYEHLAREIMNRIQKLRKSAGLTEKNKVIVQHEVLRNGKEADLLATISCKREVIETKTDSILKDFNSNSFGKVIKSDFFEIKDSLLKLTLREAC